MNIYKLNNKEIKKEIKKFNKTTYGKIVFVQSFTTSIFLIIFTLISVISAKLTCGGSYMFACGLVYLFLPVAIFVILITFIIGTCYYYKELKDFIKQTNNK